MVLICLGQTYLNKLGVLQYTTILMTHLAAIQSSAEAETQKKKTKESKKLLKATSDYTFK